MRARFDSKCRICNKRIKVGQDIDLSFYRAVHAACGAKERSRVKRFSERTAAILAMYEKAGAR